MNRSPAVVEVDGRSVVSTAFTRAIAEEERKQKRREKRALGSRTKAKVKSRERAKIRRATSPAELKKMPYKGYLKTPHWDFTRKKALRRACGACEICRSRYNLNVHHLTYSRIGREKLSDLQVLCRGCHCNEHEGEIAGVFDPMTKAFINLVKSF